MTPIDRQPLKFSATPKSAPASLPLPSDYTGLIYASDLRLKRYRSSNDIRELSVDMPANLLVGSKSLPNPVTSFLSLREEQSIRPLRVINKTNDSEEYIPNQKVVNKGKGKSAESGPAELNLETPAQFYNQDGIPITLGVRTRFDTVSEIDSDEELTASNGSSDVASIDSDFSCLLKTKENPDLPSNPEDSEETDEDSNFRTIHSTDEYRKKHPKENYESFKDLKPRILGLCVHTLWTNRPESDFKIERLPGGSYNRIVSISVKNPNPVENTARQQIKRTLSKFRRRTPRGGAQKYNKFLTTHTSGDYIMRIPRLYRSKANSYDFEADLRTHEYVLDLGVDCPRIVTFQSNWETGIGFPYMLMEKARGWQLWDVYGHMTHQQRLQVAKQIGKICNRIYSTPRSAYGKLLQLGPVYRGHDGSIIRNAKFIEPAWLIPKGSSKTRSVSSILQQGLMHHCQMRHEEFPSIPWTKLCEMTDKLAADGAFGPEGWYFTHGDFYPRNIMADIDSDGNAQITSVLDWDMASFQPSVVSAKPPSWLWWWNLYQNNIGDEDNLDIPAGCEPHNDQAREIKEAFDKAAGPMYCKVAYHRHAYTARKIALWVWMGYDNKMGSKWPDWVEWFAQYWETFESRVRDEGFPCDQYGVLNPLYLPYKS